MIHDSFTWTTWQANVVSRSERAKLPDKIAQHGGGNIILQWKLHEIHMKLDVFKRIEYKTHNLLKQKISQPHSHPNGSFSNGCIWPIRLSDRSGQIGRFEPMQPVMIQQTHNYQARMVSWLEDVGRFAQFFLAKCFSGKFEWHIFLKWFASRWFFSGSGHLHVDSVNPQFPYFWFMFHDETSAEKETFGAMSCHCPV